MSYKITSISQCKSDQSGNVDPLASHKRSIRCRVLSIDDDPLVHPVFKKILSQDPVESYACEQLRAVDFEHDAAMDGEEGVEKIIQALQAGDPFSPHLYRHENAWVEWYGDCGAYPGI